MHTTDIQALLDKLGKKKNFIYLRACKSVCFVLRRHCKLPNGTAVRSFLFKVHLEDDMQDVFETSPEAETLV